MEQKQRVIVYIDGFNFYFGLKSNAKWKKYYWLDIVKLFEMFMRPNQELVAVKYFSAKPDDIDQSLRQNAFFQANRENPKFKLILGKYLKKSITCFKCGNVIHTHEEKETDVRIATQIIADAYQKNCDISIVVSADSDMIPAIELATEACQKVFVYFDGKFIFLNPVPRGIAKKRAFPSHGNALRHFFSVFSVGSAGALRQADRQDDLRIRFLL